MESFWYLCPAGHYEVVGEGYFKRGAPTAEMRCHATLSNGIACAELSSLVTQPTILSFEQFKDRVRDRISHGYSPKVRDEIIEEIIYHQGELTAHLSFREDSHAAMRYWQVSIPLTDDGATRAANLILATTVERPA